MIKPILHRIIVFPDAIEEKDEHFKRAKAAGLFIAEAERTREQAAVDSGKVVAIGATAFKDFGEDVPPVKIDDTIVYARYAGKNIVDADTGITYVALNDEDVIAVLTKEGA